MKIQTFSIVAGSEACNARCPFCVSKMTPHNGMTVKAPEVNWRNFRKAARLSEQQNVSTAMLTGKGEPTLFPDQVTNYLQELERFNFPFIELQTNGITISQNPEKYDSYLKEWYDLGMTTIAISIVSYDKEKNHEIYNPHQKDYMDLPELINRLHDYGYSVRLSTILADGYVDGESELEKLINFSKENDVEQLTVRPVRKPEESGDRIAANWIKNNYLKEEQQIEMEKYLESKGTKILQLMHGASVYDVRGQSVCMTDCLTNNNDFGGEELRQLIFFPDGHLRYDWQYEGAVLL